MAQVGQQVDHVKHSNEFYIRFWFTNCSICCRWLFTTVQNALKNITVLLGDQEELLNTGTFHSLAGMGTLTAGLCFGGYDGSSSTTATEEYNGSSWTNNPTGLGTTRQAMRRHRDSNSCISFWRQVWTSRYFNIYRRI